MAITVGAMPAAPIEWGVINKRHSKSAVEPKRELAAAATALWHAEAAGAPLGLAGGEAQQANGISFYSEDHPSSFIDLSYAKSRWVTRDMIKKYGLLIACKHENSGCHGKAAELLLGNWKQFSITLGRTAGGSQAQEVNVRYLHYTAPASLGVRTARADRGPLAAGAAGQSLSPWRPRPPGKNKFGAQPKRRWTFDQSA